MGYYASSSSDQDSLFLVTRPSSSDYFCRHYHQVVLESADFGTKKAKGYFSIYFSTSIDSPDSELSSTEDLENGSVVFESNSVHKRLVSIQAPLLKNEILSAFITYRRGWSPLDWWYEEKWMFKRVEVFSADHQIKVTLCPMEEMLNDGATMKYVKC